jgi:hypothetical protein
MGLGIVAHTCRDRRIMVQDKPGEKVIKTVSQKQAGHDGAYL